MSSPEVEDILFSSSPPFQPAQQRAEFYTDREDVDLEVASDYQSDASSSPGRSQQSSQKESSLVDESVAKHCRAEGDLDDNPQGSTASPSRPNKYRGPPSTWRNWTASERDLAASLDQLQTKDLSVHLYNSFKLGQKNRIRDPGWRSQTSKLSEKMNQGSKWIPPKVWTAWPLPPDIVPREHDELRWRKDVVPSGQHYSGSKRPGQHLQELLVAHVLRIAKERFHERQWEGAMELKSTTTSQEQQSRSLRRDSKGRFSAKLDHEIPGQKPVIMADDQRASEILKPTVQHMMTKLDNLLMGLHHARSAYLLADSGSESNDQISERSNSRGRPPKRKRAQAEVEESVETSNDTSDHQGNDADDYKPSRKQSDSQRRRQHAKSSSRRSRSQKFQDRKGRLGLRDWSDVFGIASMIGWPHDVISRASTRCATLFEECIKFRTLQEGGKVQQEHLYLPNAPPLAYVEHGQSDLRGGLNNRFETATIGGVHVDGFLQPIEGKKSWMYRNSKQSKRKKSSRKSSGFD